MSEKLNDLKNQLVQTKDQVIAQKNPNEMNPKEKVSHYLTEMSPYIAEVLPKHVTPERMTRIAMNVIRTNPKLLECNIKSLMGGVMEAAKLGLEPGLMGQCYLIPFEKRKQVNGQWQTVDTEAQFIIGYKGLIDLVRRSGQVSIIEARTVYENDEFDYEYGLESKLKHKPTLKDPGKPIAYYAMAKLKDGGSSFIVMSHTEMESYRDKHAKSKKGPWATDFDAMARKSCLRQLIKYLPISVENLTSFDERSGIDVHQDIVNSQLVQDGKQPVTFDNESGEIIN